jgi:hypothetical protein
MPIGKPTTAYAEDETFRQLPRTLLGGTFAMRQAGAVYLPPHPAENLKPTVTVPGTEGGLVTVALPQRTAWETRRDKSVLYPFFVRARDKAVASILSRSIVLGDDVPETVKALWENVDLRGNIGDVFLRDVLRDALGEAGVSFILVDMPPLGEVESNADLKPTDRPYWVHVRACEVLNPDNVEIVDGVPRPVSLMRSEVGVRRIDAYTVEEIKRIRVWTRAGSPGNGGPYATSEVYEETSGASGKTWVLVGGPDAMRPHAEIPLVPVYLNKVAELRGRSPFSHMADLCVSHWQKLSDKDDILFKIAPPILHRSGCTGDEAKSQVIMGAGTILYTKEARGRTEYVEHTGKSAETMREDLSSLEARLLAESMEPHIRRTGSDTATGRLLDWSEIKTEVQAWAIAVKDATEVALGMTAAYQGETEGGSIELPAAQRYDLRDAEKLKLAWEVAQGLELNRRVVLEEMKAAGVFSDDFDVSKAMRASFVNRKKEVPEVPAPEAAS